MNWSIEQTELIEWLKEYDGPKFHAIVSDPPYALISIAKRFGKEGSAPAKEGSDGRFERLGSGFMGQKWDGFESLDQYQDWVSEWSRLLVENALYPGAIALFFGGTRTYHHLGVGLERGGFEIVDCLIWLHGQGFPKSHDISKGLDKAAGVEFDAKPADGVGFMNPEGKGGWNVTKNQLERIGDSTENAKTWDGYGTALKPAWEPIFLCRAPRAKREGFPWPWPEPSYTFAQLATEFGTGALNIDGTRLPTTGRLTGTRTAGEEGRGSGASLLGSSRDEQIARDQHGPVGRWPANFTLSHDEDCVKVGEFEVEGRTINRWTEDMKPFGGGAGEEYKSEQLPPETVERWACVPSCPVRILDDSVGPKQARSSMGGGTFAGDESSMEGLRFGNRSVGDQSPQYFDIGGPSRFFYTAKASRSEKDKGLEDFWWARTGKGFMRVHVKEYLKLDKKGRAHGNIHPTVKPLELLRYLSTLSLPPHGAKLDHSDERTKRRILVPFSGSGSEIIGALQAGWDEVVGIEMDETYTEIAEARIRGTVGYF